MAATVPAFDTLAYARKLKAAGVDEAHAEAVRDAVTEGVATKTGIRDLKADVRDLKTEITNMKWVLGFLAALTLAMAARLFGAF